MYYEGPTTYKITIDRNMGWDAIRVSNGNITSTVAIISNSGNSQFTNSI